DADPHSWCGSEISRLVISVARHQQFERRLERKRRLVHAVGAAPEAPFDAYQVGQIAVIEDNGSLLSEASPFDLAGEAMQFLRRPNQSMSAVRFTRGIKTPLGTRLALGDDDSVEVEFPPDFQFPFGEEVYRSVLVNSNGDLTFGAPGGGGFGTGSLSRFINDPPRIAALFTDLNPAAATGEGGVYLRFLSGRVRVTWFELPEYGTENRSTVQVTLFTNGRFTVVFGDQVEAEEALVGFFPGGDVVPELLDYSEELPFRPQPVAIVEHFSTEPALDDIGISRAFFENFQDRYHHLLVWLDFPHSLGGGAFAFELTVKNSTRGTGEALWDVSDLFGSPGRLESYVQMGDLSRYPQDPDAPALRAFTSMDLLAHEAGHRWLAKVRYRTPSGARSDGLLGRSLAHWSFHHDTDASVMEGNDLRDNGNGTFTTVAATSGGYSALDQYLMGLIPPEEVADFFWVDNVTTPERDASPEVGVTFSGDRVDVRVDDVIAAEGERIPPAGEAPTRFRTAFLLLTRQGEPPSQASLDKLERFRRRWTSYFNEATDFHASVGSAIFPK
ncbi:MAG: hypothetical protein GY856_18555, partial [bacterium]|nr:hypothetical protein [bacterium]